MMPPFTLEVASMKRLLASLVLLASCVPDTGRDVVEVSLASAGSGPEAVMIDGFTVTFARADVAIGPLYFCATEVPDFDRCESALFERLDPFVVDALDPAFGEEGPMEGTTGGVRTAFFDYGISWYLTAAEPSAGPAELGGHSAIFEGTATRGLDVVRFSASVDVAPAARGAVVVKAAPADFEVRGGETVVVAVEPEQLFAGVDFDEVLAQVVDPSTPVVIAEGSQAYEAIRFQMTGGAPPTFEWQAP